MCGSNRTSPFRDDATGPAETCPFDDAAPPPLPVPSPLTRTELTPSTSLHLGSTQARHRRRGLYAKARALESDEAVAILRARRPSSPASCESILGFPCPFMDAPPPPLSAAWVVERTASVHSQCGPATPPSSPQLFPETPPPAAVLFQSLLRFNPVPSRVLSPSTADDPSTLAWQAQHESAGFDSRRGSVKGPATPPTSPQLAAVSSGVDIPHSTTTGTRLSVSHSTTHFASMTDPDQPPHDLPSAAVSLLSVTDVGSSAQASRSFQPLASASPSSAWRLSEFASQRLAPRHPSMSVSSSCAPTGTGDAAPQSRSQSIGYDGAASSHSTRNSRGHRRGYTKLFVGQVPPWCDAKEWLAGLFEPYGARDIIVRSDKGRRTAFLWCGSRAMAEAAVAARNGHKYENKGVWYSLCVEPSTSGLQS